MAKALIFLKLDDISANEGNTIEQKGSLSRKWPNWAKVFSLLGIFLILFFFVDIPVQQSYSVEVLLNNQQWELTETGIFWDTALWLNDSLSINLKVFENLQVIFYIDDEIGNRWLNVTTKEFSENWRVPMSGKFYINIDNPYIQERPRGTISITRYMVTPEYRIDYPYRWLQIGLLIMGIVLMAIGFSAHPKFTRTNNTSGIPPTGYIKRC